jgi:NADH:ubiquinone oxidoreductase subunit 5 (subunit L)/multisubunit Na+/H+ antiporter MnhA subunit
MNYQTVFTLLGVCVVASPAALLAALGLSALLDRTPDERTTAQLTQAAVFTGLSAAIAILAMMLALGTRHVQIDLGNWVLIEHEHFHFKLEFVFDRLSVPFVILTYLLCGTVGAFASVYMLREPGRGRFFLFFALFFLGMIVASTAGTIETLFLGWELVGLSSALLVAFFQDRPAPARNGQWMWIVYRIADASFLVAAVALHHMTGGGEFDKMIGAGPWPAGEAALTSNQAFLIGSLLLFAAAGKSGLIPFTGWLPRAMEGPTPSSAIFYGALSVHLGAFLLMRVSPILAVSPLLCALVVAVGLLTALIAAMAARVQSDVKSALAFSSATQVGIIVAEIGLGFRYLALAHIIGHACLRTLQLLRAPTLLRDYAMLENAIGERLAHHHTIWERLIQQGFRLWLYRFALERGYLDALLLDYVARPVVGVFQWCDAMERRWTNFLSGGASQEPAEVLASPETLERLENTL